MEKSQQFLENLQDIDDQQMVAILATQTLNYTKAILVFYTYLWLEYGLKTHLITA